MHELVIDNKTISKPIIDILKDIKACLKNGKLASLKVKGDNIQVTCPVHKNGLEHKPSCNVYIGNDNQDLHVGEFHCFTCGAKGPFYRFVAECFESDDEWAKNWLIENYADGIIEYQLELPEITLNKNINQKEYLSESILDTFEDFHPYMLKRKLTQEVCKNFEVKYDPKGKCLVFPVRDEKGKLVMLTRRSVENKTFIIDADKEKPLYLLYYILNKNIQEVIITEGQIDALTAWTYGKPAIATMGSISKQQINELNKSGIRVLYTMFDNDDAGRRFTSILEKNIRKDIILINVKIPFGYKDINDLSKEKFYECLSNSLNAI